MNGVTPTGQTLNRYDLAGVLVHASLAGGSVAGYLIENFALRATGAVGAALTLGVHAYRRRETLIRYMRVTATFCGAAADQLEGGRAHNRRFEDVMLHNARLTGTVDALRETNRDLLAQIANARSLIQVQIQQQNIAEDHRVSAQVIQRAADDVCQRISDSQVAEIGQQVQTIQELRARIAVLERQPSSPTVHAEVADHAVQIDAALAEVERAVTVPISGEAAV